MKPDIYYKDDFKKAKEDITKAALKINKDFIPLLEKAFSKNSTNNFKIEYESLTLSPYYSSSAELNMEITIKEGSRWSTQYLSVQNFFTEFLKALEGFFSRMASDYLKDHSIFNSELTDYIKTRKEIYDKCAKDLRKDLAIPLYILLKQKDDWISYLIAEKEFVLEMRRCHFTKDDVVLPAVIDKKISIKSISEKNFKEKRQKLLDEAWKVVNPENNEVMRKNNKPYRVNYFHTNPFITKEFEEILKLIKD